MSVRYKHLCRVHLYASVTHIYVGCIITCLSDRNIYVRYASVRQKQLCRVYHYAPVRYKHFCRYMSVRHKHLCRVRVCQTHFYVECIITRLSDTNIYVVYASVRHKLLFRVHVCQTQIFM